MDHEEISRLLDIQSGVIARTQLLARGAKPHDIKRLVRRKEMTAVVTGVYVNHTGDPTWLQRAWAGTLALAPAVLSGMSALRAVAGPGWRTYDDAGPIELAVSRDRRLAVPDGYRLSHLSGLDARVQWNASPPRLRVEEATLQVAARQDSEWRAIGILTDACGTRRTTAARLLAALDGLTRLPGREFLRRVLLDIDTGACSVLEQGYLRLVEAPHGLPSAQRQVVIRRDRGREYRDVTYDDYRVDLELDGRVYHESSTQRDLDLDRDLDSAVAGAHAVRLGWGQVFTRPCRTAERIAALLTRRGWGGTLTTCGPGCSLLDAA